MQHSYATSIRVQNLHLFIGKVSGATYTYFPTARRREEPIRVAAIKRTYSRILNWICTWILIREQTRAFLMHDVKMWLDYYYNNITYSTTLHCNSLKTQLRAAQRMNVVENGVVRISVTASSLCSCRCACSLLARKSRKCLRDSMRANP